MISVGVGMVTAGLKISSKILKKSLMRSRGSSKIARSIDIRKKDLA